MLNSTTRCSCIVCHQERSARGIHSHYRIAHTKEGREKNSRNLKVASKIGAQVFSDKAKSLLLCSLDIYLAAPNKCMECNDPLPYDKRNNTFCSQSCAATYNNKDRILNGYKPSLEHRAKTSKSLSGRPSTVPRFTSIKFCVCEVCKIEFIWNTVSKGSSRFCSKECSHINRSNKARNNPGLGTKRSKLEIELYDLCAKHFKIVVPNEKLVNGWDADIVIYDIKTAILWNGPWHYCEMNFGNHSLKQVQNRDQIKIKEFTNAGWLVIIFEDRYFTPQSAFATLVGAS